MNSDTILTGIAVLIVSILAPYFVPPYPFSAVFYIGGVCVGVGIVLYGLVTKPKKKYQPKVCGNCLHFNTPECIREEKLPNAMPCEIFLRKQSA